MELQQCWLERQVIKYDTDNLLTRFPTSQRKIIGTANQNYRSVSRQVTVRLAKYIFFFNFEEYLAKHCIIQIHNITKCNPPSLWAKLALAKILCWSRDF